jgi:hypothetical protein
MVPWGISTRLTGVYINVGMWSRTVTTGIWNAYNTPVGMYCFPDHFGYLLIYSFVCGIRQHGTAATHRPGY